jgi:hypothetical protein
VLAVTVALYNFLGTAGRAFDMHVVTIMADEHMGYMEAGSGRSACRFFDSFLIHTIP